MIRCLDRKPKKAGDYNIAIEGVFTFMPIFMRFDGEEWVWNEHELFGQTKEDVYWFPGEDE